MSLKLKDIAKMAGVSEATASLALNDHSIVKEETRIKVKQIAKELGYSPNAMARGLAKRKSGTIGLIVPDIESAYYGRLIKSIDESVREWGYGLVLAISNDKREIEKQIVNSFISQRVEAVIIAPINQVNSDLGYLKQLEKHMIPCVFVTAHYPHFEAPFVMVDLEEGTYKLVNYLLDLGHRDIFFLAGSPEVITTSYRINGYIKAFNERGIPFDSDKFIQCNKLNYDQAGLTTSSLLKSKVKIDSIISINDMMALGVLNTLKAHKINVPGEISVAGYDNMIFSNVSSIPIRTINQDIEEMSSRAVSIAVSLIKGGNESEKTMIKPELIIRESTGLKG